MSFRLILCESWIGINSARILKKFSFPSQVLHLFEIIILNLWLCQLDHLLIKFMVVIFSVEIALDFIIYKYAFDIILPCNCLLVLSSCRLELYQTTVRTLFFQFLQSLPKRQGNGVEGWMRKLIGMVERFVKAHILY